MKRLFLVAVLVGTLGLISGAEPAGQAASAAEPNKVELRRFDLDFPGGTAQELVDALNKPLLGMLNVVIPFGTKEVLIPPLKLRDVNVVQVFQALSSASQRFKERTVGPHQTQQFSERYDFSTMGVPTENSVWSFRVEQPPTFADEQPTYRFYQLGPYLENLKVEDITTAIQTALKMLDIEPGPRLKFHPETKLLIAVGQPSDFQLIDDVLKELGKGMPTVRMNHVLVTGAVNRPMLQIDFPEDQKLTVLEAIERAGGPTADAKKVVVSGHRGERVMTFDELRKETDPAKTMILERGDRIEVKR